MRISKPSMCRSGSGCKASRLEREGITMVGNSRRGLVASVWLVAAVVCVSPAKLHAEDHRLALPLRSRVDAPGYGAYRVVESPASWDARRTAVIVCDMWDLHHCLNA